MTDRYKELRQEAFEANMELVKQGLVIFTFGNVSAFDRDQGVFAIKPSGVPYNELKYSDMVIVNLDNHIVDGKLRPSSDTKTHAYLFKSWPDINGIAHTHSTYAVAWAQAQMPIPILGTTHADHLTDDIPCTPTMPDDWIAGDYEHLTGKQIVDHFSDLKLSPAEIEMVLIGNHDPFSWGKNAQSAVYNSKILEEIAKMAFLTLQINPQAPRLKEALIKKHYERKHGSQAYYGQNNTKES